MFVSCFPLNHCHKIGRWRRFLGTVIFDAISYPLIMASVCLALFALWLTVKYCATPRRIFSSVSDIKTVKYPRYLPLFSTMFQICPVIVLVVFAMIFDSYYLICLSLNSYDHRLRHRNLWCMLIFAIYVLFCFGASITWVMTLCTERISVFYVKFSVKRNFLIKFHIIFKFVWKPQCTKINAALSLRFSFNSPF